MYKHDLFLLLMKKYVLMKKYDPLGVIKIYVNIDLDFILI